MLCDHSQLWGNLVASKTAHKNLSPIRVETLYIHEAHYSAEDCLSMPTNSWSSHLSAPKHNGHPLTVLPGRPSHLLPPPTMASVLAFWGGLRRNWAIANPPAAAKEPDALKIGILGAANIA